MQPTTPATLSATTPTQVRHHQQQLQMPVAKSLSLTFSMAGHGPVHVHDMLQLPLPLPSQLQVSPLSNSLSRPVATTFCHCRLSIEAPATCLPHMQAPIPAIPALAAPSQATQVRMNECMRMGRHAHACGMRMPPPTAGGPIATPVHAEHAVMPMPCSPPPPRPPPSPPPRCALAAATRVAAVRANTHRWIQSSENVVASAAAAAYAARMGTT